MTKREAEAFQDAERVATRRGLWTDPRASDTTVAELADLWVAANPAKRSGTTARDANIVRRRVNPTLGARSIGSVRQPDVQGMVNAWCRLSSPRTVRRQYGVLRAMFAFAVNTDLLSRSPCRTISLPEVVPVRRKLPDAEGLFHDLRRANAPGVVADKVDIKTAQIRLGHSDPCLTLAVYAQSTAAGDLEAADMLASRFMPSQQSAR